MKIVLFWSFYGKYLDCIYASSPNLASLSYRDQLGIILSDAFGWPPAVVNRMSELNCEVQIIIVNALPLQRAWAIENGIPSEGKNWADFVALQQVKRFKPDVLWIGSMPKYFGGFLSDVRGSCGKIFAWIASASSKSLDLSSVDCILTSHRNFRDEFRSQGKKSEIILPAFESNVLKAVGGHVRDIENSFFCSISYHHLDRLHTLNELVKRTDLRLWTDQPPLISRGILDRKFVINYLRSGNLRDKSSPGVWGLGMYEILARSKVTVNIHVDAASGLAGNMRMFEATGVGALLMTENAPNIADLYSPGSEVVTYDSMDDLVSKISYYQSHPQERAKIAAAGQKRVLAQHNTVVRSKELLTIFESVK
jgi:spore maturation protein CgeB